MPSAGSPRQKGMCLCNEARSDVPLSGAAGRNEGCDVKLTDTLGPGDDGADHVFAGGADGVSDLFRSSSTLEIVFTLG